MRIISLFLLICLSANSTNLYCQILASSSKGDLATIELEQIEEKKVALNKDRREYLKHKIDLEEQIEKFEIDKKMLEINRAEFETSLKENESIFASIQEELVKINNQKSALNEDRKQFLIHKKELEKSTEKFNAAQKEFAQLRASFESSAKSDNSASVAYEQAYAQLNDQKLALNKDRQQFQKHKKELEKNMEKFNEAQKEFAQLRASFKSSVKADNSASIAYEQAYAQLNDQKLALNKDRKRFQEHQKELEKKIEEFDIAQKEFELSKASQATSLEKDNSIQLAYEEAFAKLNDQKVALNKDRQQFLEHKKNLEEKIESFKVAQNEFELSKASSVTSLEGDNSLKQAYENAYAQLNQQKIRLNEDRQQFLEHREALKLKEAELDEREKEIERVHLEKAQLVARSNASQNSSEVMVSDVLKKIEDQKIALGNHRNNLLSQQKALEQKELDLISQLSTIDSEVKMLEKSQKALQAFEESYSAESFNPDMTLVTQTVASKEVPAQFLEDSSKRKFNVRASAQAGKIQVAALISDSRSFEKLSHLGTLTVEKIKSKNLYRYKIIPFGNRNLNEVLAEIRTTGFPDAFVTN